MHIKINHSRILWKILNLLIKKPNVIDGVKPYHTE